MLDETNFLYLKRKASDFKYSNLEQADYEDCKNWSVIDSTNYIFLFNPDTEIILPFYAADTPEQLISALAEFKNRTIRINFTPHEFLGALTKAGFTVFAEYIDYFCENLRTACHQLYITPPEFASSADVSQLTLLSKKCRFLSRGFTGESTEWFTQWLTEGGSIFIFRAEGRLIGFCCVTIYASGTILWIREIAIDPVFQKRGIGHILLSQAFAYGLERGAKRSFLHCDILNESAIRLYKSFGFIPRDTVGELQMIREANI